MAGRRGGLFQVACQITVYVALNCGAGYFPNEPAGEHAVFWLEPPSCTPGNHSPFQPWCCWSIPTIGGILSGVIVFTFAPEAEGHGTDAAIAAYHDSKGEIRPRVPIIKIVASALTIGTGGSGGREGPIAQIGAGFGSFLGGLSAQTGGAAHADGGRHGCRHRRHLPRPLAGALFAAEVLYRSPDFESEVIMPAGLACVTAYCTFGWSSAGSRYPLRSASIGCSRSTTPGNSGRTCCSPCSWSSWP